MFPASFAALINLRDRLNAGDARAVSSQSLTEIDAAMDSVMSARATNGARVNRVEQAKDRQELLQVNLQDLLSKAQDTDMADAASKFSIQETLYKASLEAASKAIQPSLLDYLR